VQLRLTLVLDIDAPPTVLTRPDGSLVVALALDGLADVDATWSADGDEAAALGQRLVNDAGLRASRRSLTLARRPDDPTPA
jgi:hypothetical protein